MKSFINRVGKGVAEGATSAREAINVAQAKVADGASTAREAINSTQAKWAAEKEEKARAAAFEKDVQAKRDLSDFRAAHTAAMVEKLEVFFNSPVDAEFYCRPGAAKADTGAAAIARRIAPFALKAIEYTGYGRVAVAVKAVIKYSDIAALLMHPTFRELCKDLIPRLIQPAQEVGLPFASTRHGAIEAELALRLWYLGCSEAMKAMTGPSDSDASMAVSAETVEEQEVSDATLLQLAEWIGPTQWLGHAYKLPAPHHTPEWAAWYASRLAAKTGWTVIACHGAAKKDACVVPTFPEKTRVPAWLLAAHPDSKRAVLTLRGTHTPNDALIDADYEPAAWESADGVRHVAHRGMLRAAKAILDECGGRVALDQLRAAGYSLAIVGHSLGAGVGAIITALLTLGERAAMASDPSAPPPPPPPPPYTDVLCLAYASPACVDRRLADLLKPFVVAAVHNDDIVPRLTDANLRQLTLDLLEDDANYKPRLAADRAAYTEYVKTLGKTQAMSHAEDDEEGSAVAGGDAGGGGGAGGKVAAPEDVHLQEGSSHNDNSSSNTAMDVDGPPPPQQHHARPLEEEEELAVPGAVVLLRGREAFMTAILGDHRLPALQRIHVTQRAVSDHRMSTYAKSFRALWHRRGHAPPPRPPVPFAPVTAAGGNGWTPCSVCGSDVTWTAMAKGSDALRVQATHHCRACGQVVCAFCAPAGDRIAGDRLGEFAHLSDLRVPIPSQDYLLPVRVCMPCSYRGHEI